MKRSLLCIEILQHNTSNHFKKGVKTINTLNRTKLVVYFRLVVPKSGFLEICQIAVYDLS